MRGELYAALKRCIEAERVAVLVTLLDGPAAGAQLLVPAEGSSIGDLGGSRLNERAAARARDLARRLGTERASLDDGEREVEVFLETHAPRPQLVVLGGVHVAIPLVEFAGTMGFRTVVVDPRTAFATRERFPHADELITEWPREALSRIRLNESSCVAVLSHDIKLDVPALELALGSPARYIGALGSRRTHTRRVRALEQAGCEPEAIARIHNPIGLDLGGRRAEEIALAIMAEIVAVTHGRRP